MREYEGRGVAGVHPNRGVVVVPEACQRDRGCGREQGAQYVYQRNRGVAGIQEVCLRNRGCGRCTRGVAEEVKVYLT